MQKITSSFIVINSFFKHKLRNHFPMADKYDPTTDVHNLFMFVMIPILVNFTLSFNYKKYMMKFLLLTYGIFVSIYVVLPTVLYSYRSNFFEIFGKTRFIIIYFGLPFLLMYATRFIYFILELYKDIKASKNNRII